MDFLAFLRKAAKPHAGREIQVALDNLPTHTTPEAKAWPTKNPHVHFHFTPAGSSWVNQIEIWFGSCPGRLSAAAPSPVSMS